MKKYKLQSYIFWEIYSIFNRLYFSYILSQFTKIVTYNIFQFHINQLNTKVPQRGLVIFEYIESFVDLNTSFFSSSSFILMKLHYFLNYKKRPFWVLVSTSQLHHPVPHHLSFQKMCQLILLESQHLLVSRSFALLAWVLLEVLLKELQSHLLLRQT